MYSITSDTLSSLSMFGLLDIYLLHEGVSFVFDNHIPIKGLLSPLSGERVRNLAARPREEESKFFGVTSAHAAV